MELVRRTIDTVVELVPTSSQSGQSVSCDSKPVARDDNCKVEEIRFTDDLRTEDFNYIVNESSNFYPPSLIFHSQVHVFVSILQLLLKLPNRATLYFTMATVLCPPQ